MYKTKRAKFYSLKNGVSNQCLECLFMTLAAGADFSDYLALLTGKFAFLDTFDENLVFLCHRGIAADATSAAISMYSATWFN